MTQIPLELHKVITYDGVEYSLSLSQIRWVLDQAANAGLPPVNYITQRAYKQDGASEVAYYLQPRTISINFRTGTCSRDQYWDARAELLNIMRPNRNGTYATYIFSQADGTQRAIRGRPITPTFPPNDPEVWDEFAVQEPIDIQCFDPTWFDPNLNSVLATAQALTTREYTFGIPVAYQDNEVTLNTVSTGNYRLAQLFKVDEDCTLKTLQLYLKKTGTPAGTITVRLETLTDNKPSGTLVHANATGTISEAGLTTSLALVTVDFTDFAITAGRYAIVISSDRADSDVNYVSFGVYYNNLLDKLVSYWELEEASGERLDSQGSNDLSVSSGTVDDENGKVMQSALFNGTDFLYVPDIASLSAGDTDFLLKGWIKITTLATTGFLAKWGALGYEYLLLYDNAANRMIFVVSADGTLGTLTSVTANTFGAISADTWYHVAAWHDAANDLIGISVNGSPDTTATAAGVWDGGEIFTVGTSLVGQLDECAFYRRVLTSAELDQLYSLGRGTHFYDIRHDYYFWQSWEKLTSLDDWSSEGNQLIHDFLVETESMEELVFPITFPIYFMGNANQYTLSISYVGTWYSYPVIVVAGATNGFTITHDQLGKSIQYLNAVANGETITITLGDMPTVVSSVDGDVISSLSPDSDLQAFRIEPDPIVTNGLNTFTIQAANTDGGTSFTVRYYTRYIGI